MTQTVGLALGGGGARGWAHLGVLRALEHANIKIDYLAGTSIGSFIGAVYIADALDDLEAFAEEVDLQTLLPLLDVSFPNTGLIRGDRIHDFVQSYVFDKCIEDSNIPFRCVATNFLLKKEVILHSGLLVDAVRASISIPGIFAPVQREKNVFLVDGGVVNPVPVSVVRAMGADIVIAINLNKDPKSESPPTKKDSNVKTDKETGKPISDADQSETSKSNIDAEDESLLSSLENRYEGLKDVLQDKVDDWIPDPSTGLNVFDVLGNSINVMEQRVTEANLSIDKPDILIEPNLLEFGIFDFHQSKAMIHRGYEAVSEALPEIRELLDASHQ
ncbi:MAG: patatin-like phospholipase family protein [Leptolyngbyaceae bacterium]|nr:patatin-like phospholipase family protein [Leptolyngbyaceae bacterium]